MTTVGLFRVDPQAKTLEEVEEKDLSVLGLKERYDLQEWIERNPTILGEPLLIIAKECNSFDTTNERADLVALDEDGNIVVIELKRDDSGTNVQWQAIKYASYFAKAKLDVIVALLANHSKTTLDEATKVILEFTHQDDVSMINREQRIILVSHRFAREATSAVLWLRDRGVDVSCVQLTPYHDTITKGLYLQATIIIPIPGTDNFTVSVAAPGTLDIVTPGSRKKEDASTLFLRSCGDKVRAQLEDVLHPEKVSRWAGVSRGERYFFLWYLHAPWQNYHFAYKMCLFSDKGEGKMSVGLNVVDAQALKAGSAEQLEALKSEMNRFADEQGLTFLTEEGKWTWLGVILSAPETDATLQADAVQKLALLVRHFTPFVEKLFESVNQVEA